MNHRGLLSLFRSSHGRCSLKEGVLKRFANFTAKHLCWGLFLIKLQAQVKFAKFLRTFILKNICQRLLLFVSSQNTIASSSGKFGVDATLAKYFFKHNNLIRSNAAISFIKHKSKKVPLTFQITFLLNFDCALLKYSILHLVSQVATMSLRNRLAQSGNSTYCKIPFITIIESITTSFDATSVTILSISLTIQYYFT